MNTSHILSLAALHNAAPGVLDVVFGADGDFEGAPSFAGPVRFQRAGWTQPEWLHIRQIETPGRGVYDGGWAELESCALDGRIPAVAARLAGLCARALGDSGEGWRVVYVGMTWTLTDGLSQMFCWDALGKPRANTPPHMPSVQGRPFMSGAHFLAALTIALAPRIAALKGTP